AFALRGATVVAIAWPVVQLAFAQYLTHVDFTRVYGALTAPLVLLLWFYCIGSIFLFGAEYSIEWPTGYPASVPEELPADG
ncbi:MAG: YihY/virulence factor BrkB family protein, partial [Candidatus Eremiobacteraeota bacterium]|nr:YihY/virulence factor BrkB family protein [Candidatus Eremiobacteraeota bacterium]